MPILPGMNRRELLSSAVAATVARMPPNASQTEALPESDVLQPIERLLLPSAAESQAANFVEVTVVRLQEIAQRNRIRQEAGLPLLSVAKELRRMKQAADVRKFGSFADAHRKRVREKMQQRMRRQCGDPKWQPAGMLSGGGLAFAVQVERQLTKLHRRVEQKQTYETRCPLTSVDDPSRS